MGMINTTPARCRVGQCNSKRRNYCEARREADERSYRNRPCVMHKMAGASTHRSDAGNKPNFVYGPSGSFCGRTRCGTRVRYTQTSSKASGASALYEGPGERKLEGDQEGEERARQLPNLRPPRRPFDPNDSVTVDPMPSMLNSEQGHSSYFKALLHCMIFYTIGTRGLVCGIARRGECHLHGF